MAAARLLMTPPFRSGLRTIASILGPTALLLAGGAADADINPWIAANLYDPGKWDTAGPRAATPWLHPAGWTPGQDWGALSGRGTTAAALTGSWGGLRDRLFKQGVSLFAAYHAQPMFNLSGGEKTGSSFIGDFGTGLFVDLQRVAGWNGSFFTLSADWKGGDAGLTADAIGNEFPVQISSGDNAFRLLHLALGQQLVDNKAEIVAGRIVTGEDFATLQLACTSLNQAICGNPIAAARSISFPTYPFGVWGARAKIKPASDWYAQLGTYLVHPDFRDPGDHGVEFGAPDGSGMLTLAEYGRQPGAGPTSNGLPGTYKIGAYYDGERVTDQRTGTDAWGTWGLYAMGQQRLTTDSSNASRGLSAWLALSYAPPERNEMDFMTAGGLSYRGPFDSRANDALSLVASYGHFSADLAEYQRELGEEQQGHEMLLEINYRAQIAPWIYVQPDIQYIVRPSGYDSIPDALAVGFALGLVF